MHLATIFQWEQPASSTLAIASTWVDTKPGAVCRRGCIGLPHLGDIGASQPEDARAMAAALALGLEVLEQARHLLGRVLLRLLAHEQRAHVLHVALAVCMHRWSIRSPLLQKTQVAMLSISDMV